MPAEDPKQAYEALKKEIRYHNYRYYVLNDPVVSDFEYDQLTQKLTAIEAQYPDWITPDSPSHAPERNLFQASRRSPTRHRSSA